MREIITLACQDCKRRNYSTTKNRRKSTERLELRIGGFDNRFRQFSDSVHANQYRMRGSKSG